MAVFFRRPPYLFRKSKHQKQEVDPIVKDLKKALSQVAICCVLAVFLQGCSPLWGPRPDIVSEEKTKGRTYSNAETRKILIDQPSTLSGDYFRQRSRDESPETTIGFDGIVQNAPDDTRAEASQAEWPRKIGLLFDDTTITGPRAEALVREAARALPPEILLVGPDRLRDLFASEECGDDVDCISGKVSPYPGVRILVSAEELLLPKDFPGKGEIEFQVIDADIMYAYPSVALTATLGKQSDVDAFLYQACRRVLADARRYAEIMPPHARVFSVQGARMYISAGRLSGIAPGAVFQVVSGGETVYAPSGVPVGWVPADSKATVRVDMLVGEDAAGCSLVEGDEPATGDYVLQHPGK